METLATVALSALVVIVDAVQQMKTNENAAIEAAKGKGNGTPAVLERLSALEAARGVR